MTKNVNVLLQQTQTDWGRGSQLRLRGGSARAGPERGRAGAGHTARVVLEHEDGGRRRRRGEHRAGRGVRLVRRLLRVVRGDLGAHLGGRELVGRVDVGAGRVEVLVGDAAVMISPGPFPEDQDVSALKAWENGRVFDNQGQGPGYKNDWFERRVLDSA